MFKRFLGKFSKELAIDLGTSMTRIFVKNQGLLIHEPSIVAVNSRTSQVLCIGEEAKKMLGKTPPHIQAVKPVVCGVISDFEIVESMLKHFIDRVHQDGFHFLPRPRVMTSIPLDVTEVERKAVEDVLYAAGASAVHMVESPIAAAVGARLPVLEAQGLLVVDIGAGKTEIAVISLGGIVISKSFRVAGDEMTKNIISYVRDKYNLLLGEKMAEEVKIDIGSTVVNKESKQYQIRGRDLLTGLPKQMMINDVQIREAISRSIKVIIDNIKAVLEMTPPELSADIYQRGMMLSGGASQLHGLSQTIYEATQVPVHIADEPSLTMVTGSSIMLEDEALMQKVALMPMSSEQLK